MDDIVKFTSGANYMPLGVGATGVAVANEHAYGALRLAISDTLPGPDHAAYQIVRQRDFVQHLEIKSGFGVFVRSDDPAVMVSGHFRAFA